MRIFSMAVFAITLSLFGTARAAETVLWSGVIPDAVGGGSPTISNYFIEQPAGLYYLHTDGEVSGNPIFKIQINARNQALVGNDGTYIPIVDQDNYHIFFVNPWVTSIDDGFLIDLYGFDDGITNQSRCCESNGVDPLFWHFNQTFVQNLNVTVLFTDDSAGKSFTLTYGGAAVPEPATWAMMIAGFGLVGSSLRRRRAIAA